MHCLIEGDPEQKMPQVRDMKRGFPNVTTPLKAPVTFCSSVVSPLNQLEM